MVYAGDDRLRADGNFKPARGCRPVFVLRRGDVDPARRAGGAGRAVVRPGLEATFALPTPNDEGARRAALAKWLTRPEERADLAVDRQPRLALPLRPRHRRHAQRLRPDGRRAEHPELLDWLAVSFRDDAKGSLKQLHRLIVTSSAYRQSSDAQRRVREARRRQPLALADEPHAARRRERARRGAADHRQARPDDGRPVGEAVRHDAGHPRDAGRRLRNFDADARRTSAGASTGSCSARCPTRSWSRWTARTCRSSRRCGATSVTALQALAMLNDHFIVRQSEHLAERVAKASPELAEQIDAIYQARAEPPGDGEGDRAAVARTRRSTAWRTLPAGAEQQRVHVRELRSSARCAQAHPAAVPTAMSALAASSAPRVPLALGGGLGGIALAHLLGSEDLLADAAGRAPQPQRRPAPPRQGQARHPALHERRRVARWTRSSTARSSTSCTASSSTPARAEGRIRHRLARRVPADEVPVRVQAARPVRRVGQQRLPAPRHLRRRHRVPPSMASKTNVHGPGSYMMNTGFVLPGFPCMGAWISYGLGSLSRQPARRSSSCPTSGACRTTTLGNFSSGFLPVAHAGHAHQADGDEPDRRPVPAGVGEVHHEAERGRRAGAARADEPRPPRRSAKAIRGSTRASQSYELAAKMQLSAPEVLDSRGETEATRRLYGLDDKPHAGLRPALPRRPADARARRAVRAGLERPRRGDQQLGQPRRHPKRAAGHRRRRSTSRSPRC